LPHVYSRGGAAEIRKHEPVVRSSLLCAEEGDDDDEPELLRVAEDERAL
jgi:hypothetical protein